MSDNVNPGRRKTFFTLLAVAIGFGGWLTVRESEDFIEPEDPMAAVAKFVKPQEKWTGSQFLEFLNALPAFAMLELKQTLGLVKKDATEPQLSGGINDALAVQKEAFWVSKNVVSYYINDATKLDYHEVVAWVCKTLGVPQALIEKSSTFQLEREIQKLIFIDLWDRMDNSQREAVLKEVDPNGAISDKAATAALGGAAALAILNAAVAAGGFAFYTGMSVAIASAASLAGVTLPFAAYAGASWAVGLLSGPVGWAAMTITGLGSAAFLSRANMKKTIRLVSAIHAIKVKALLASGMREKEIYEL